MRIAEPVAQRDYAFQMPDRGEQAQRIGAPVNDERLRIEPELAGDDALDCLAAGIPQPDSKADRCATTCGSPPCGATGFS
jgi:hypothetical protein